MKFVNSVVKKLGKIVFVWILLIVNIFNLNNVLVKGVLNIELKFVLILLIIKIFCFVLFNWNKCVILLVNVFFI